MITCNIDTRGLNSDLAALQDALIGSGQAGDATNLIEQEARLFMKMVIKLTPPKNQAQGRNAVQRDIGKTMRPLDPSDWKSQKLKLRIDALIKAGNEQALQKLFRSFKNGKKNVQVHRFDQRIHRMNRKSRGRVMVNRRNTLVFTKKAYNDYLKKMQARVGRFKASWGQAYLAHGGKLSPWISRHLPTPKAIHYNGLADRSRPTIIFGSASPGARDLRRVLASTLAARRQAIQRRIKLIESGYAKDIVAGMRPRRKVQRTPDNELVS